MDPGCEGRTAGSQTMAWHPLCGSLLRLVPSASQPHSQCTGNGSQRHWGLVGIAPPTWALCPSPPLQVPGPLKYGSDLLSRMHPSNLDSLNYPAHRPCFFLNVFFLHHTILRQDSVPHDLHIELTLNTLEYNHHLWRQGLERMIKVSEVMTVGKL